MEVVHEPSVGTVASGDASRDTQAGRARNDTLNDDDDGGYFLDRGSFECGPVHAASMVGSDNGNDCGGSGDGNNDDVVEMHRRDSLQSNGVGDDDGGAGGEGPLRRKGSRGYDDSDNDTLLTSPRKKQRLRNLRLAKGMDRARDNDIAVVGCWIPSVP